MYRVHVCKGLPVLGTHTGRCTHVYMCLWLSWSQVLLWLLSVYWGRVSFFEFRSHLWACLASQPSQGICCLPTKNWDYRWLPSWPAFMWVLGAQTRSGPYSYTIGALSTEPSSPAPPPLSAPPPRSSFKEKEKKKKPFVKSQVSAPHLKFRPSSVIFQLGPFITCPCFLYLLFRG